MNEQNVLNPRARNGMGTMSNYTSNKEKEQSKYFKGISKEAEDIIFNYVDTHATNQLQKNMMANDLYKKALEEADRRKTEKERQSAKTDMNYRMVTTKDTTQANQISTQLRMGDVADIIREDARKNGYNLTKIDDNTVVNNYINDNPKYAQQVKAILGGKGDINAFAEELGVFPDTTSVRGGGLRRGAVNEMVGERTKAGENTDTTLNPIGAAFEWLDKQAQKLPSFTGEGMKNKLRERIENLSEEELANYRKQYDMNSNWQLYGSFENFVEMKEKTFWDELLGVDLNENEGLNLGRMIVNAIPSAVKTTTSIARGITNPYDTAKGIYKLVTTEEGKQAIIDRYGSWDAFQKSVEQDPVGVASDILTLVQGGASVAGKAAKYGAKVSAAAGMEKAAEGLSKFSAAASDAAKTAGATSNLGLDVVKSKVVPNALKKGMESSNSLVKGASKLADRSLRNQTDFMSTNLKRLNNASTNLANRSVGITKDIKSRIQSNPEISEYVKKVDESVKNEGRYTEGKEYTDTFYNEIANEVESRLNKQKDKLSTDSEIYNEYKKSGDTLTTNSAKEKVDEILSNRKITRDTIKTKKGEKKQFNYKDSALTNKSEGLEDIYDYLERHNELKGDEVLTFNEKLNNAIGSAKKGSSEWALLTDIKKAIKDDFHSQSPVYKKLDSLYEEDIKFLNEISEGLTKRNGTVKENLNGIIKRLKNNPKQAERLEQLYPGITKKVEALDIMPKMLDNIYKGDTNVGKIALGTATFGILLDKDFGRVIKNMLLGAGFSTAYTKVSQNRWKKVLTTLSPEGQSYIAELSQKQANGELFTNEERQAVKDLKNLLKSKNPTKKEIKQREQGTLF